MPLSMPLPSCQPSFGPIPSCQPSFGPIQSPALLPHSLLRHRAATLFLRALATLRLSLILLAAPLRAPCVNLMPILLAAVATICCRFFWLCHCAPLATICRHSFGCAIARPSQQFVTDSFSCAIKRPSQQFVVYFISCAMARAPSNGLYRVLFWPPSRTTLATICIVDSLALATFCRFCLPRSHAPRDNSLPILLAVPSRQSVADILWPS
jgi:hypothetical protein